ncbi:hypothetical protein [Polaromonas naphthalenivorans]|uniref:Uncharacterized protein n=1 Tax=Polaromonas naphthalenivorans (strain CJ2) TaxID=365044 RepID=A1VRN5_POLNA|nr:hypothetical protein [Polaromonas naphthalenivorans]ABM38313.1 conserved hypothetical protein [Polaromonas naphthalenivorans CJ2]
MNEPHELAIAGYLAVAAGIPHPWRATQYRIDEVAAMVHVWITRQPQANVKKKRSWFGLLTAVQAIAEAPVNGPEMQWRHLNCMNFTCQIHTLDVLDERHFDLPWFGQPGLPFSNRLSRQVFACLKEGLEIPAICDIHNIPFADLWKFKHALDNGQVKFEYTASHKTDTAAAGPDAHLSSAGSGNVPDVKDPVWERLITGELNIHIKTLSLQLILTKLRQQVSLQQNDEVKQLKLRELHRYVERNQRSLEYELNQFRKISQSEYA